MIKNLLIYLLVLSTTSCSTYRFIGNPITINSENLNIKLSEDDLVLFNENQKEIWPLLDINDDKIPGMSVNKANKELIKDKKGEEVIVAIIDSGVEIDHPYLSEFIWTNSNEIPNNGIDDDQNGYVDDLNGWNFLGKSDKENLEYVRLLKKSKPEDKMREIYQKEIDDAIDKNNKTLNRIRSLSKTMEKSDSILKVATGKDDYKIKDAKEIVPKSIEIDEAIRFMESAISNNWTESRFLDAIDYYESSNKYHNNIEFDGRSIVGDDPDNFNDRNYGDSNVDDTNNHGTHVSGIVRSISKSVKIMSIRCVPDGDEYDKDVALSIIYAVDNGAKVINFSFGKKFSPHSDWVNDAMQYAAEKDVLIVNAAGNSANNIDLSENKSYPSDNFDGKEFINNMITVGASTFRFDSTQVASFSNYGSKNVDIFAPGFQVYSSIRDGKFKYNNGTSMAAPHISGVAAVLRSFYPKLSASSIKSIILNSGISMNKKLKEPGSENILEPNSMSLTGKTANLYNALIYASIFKKNDPKGSLNKYKSIIK